MLKSFIPKEVLAATLRRIADVVESNREEPVPVCGCDNCLCDLPHNTDSSTVDIETHILDIDDLNDIPFIKKWKLTKKGRLKVVSEFNTVKAIDKGLDRLLSFITKR